MKSGKSDMGTIKVCHVTSVHGAYDGRIFQKECVSLAKAGYEVHLVVANARDEEKDGVRIWGVDCPAKHRLQRMTKVAEAVYKKALALKADIYHLHDPELLPFALKLKRRGAKVIFDSHEDILSIVEEKAYLPYWIRKIAQWLVNILQIYVIKRLDAIISVTPHICEKLRRFNAQVVQCTNYPLLFEVKKDSTSRKCSLVYAGGISKQWCHEYLLNAIEGVDCQYYLAGRAEEGYLLSLQTHAAWSQVLYEGILGCGQVLALYGKSDIGMALLRPGNNTGDKQGTLGNTKLFEYMMAGLPVICTDFILWKAIVEKEQCGICVPPTDTEAIKNAIRYMLEHPDEAKRMGENGRKAAEREYNWRSQEEILLRLYQSLSR